MIDKVLIGTNKQKEEGSVTTIILTDLPNNKEEDGTEEISTEGVWERDTDESGETR